MGHVLHRSATATDESPRTNPPRPRIEWIDCLRGIAVLFVVFQHIAGKAVDARYTWVDRYFDFGIFGVVIFFCISGFVIPYSIVGLKNRHAVRFPVARIFRLYPAYWLSLLLAAWIVHPGLKLELINGTMLQRFFAEPDIVGVYWTLQVELIFYLIFQAIILCRKIRSHSLYPALALSFTFLSVAMAAGRFLLGKKLPLAPPLGLAIMFLATTYFMHVTYGLFSRRTMISFAVFLYLLLALSFFLGYARDWGYGERPERFCIAYLLAMLIFLAFQAANLRSIFLGFLGSISYPVYLVHTSIIMLVGFTLHCFMLSTAVDLALILALSTVIHYTVELPFIRWGKLLLSRPTP